MTKLLTENEKKRPLIKCVSYIILITFISRISEIDQLDV